MNIPMPSKKPELKVIVKAYIGSDIRDAYQATSPKVTKADIIKVLDNNQIGDFEKYFNLFGYLEKAIVEHLSTFGHFPQAGDQPGMDMEVVKVTMEVENNFYNIRVGFL